MEFLKQKDQTNKALEEHMKNTDFKPKMKENKSPIIPYITHTIYVTKKNERSQMNNPNVWDAVDKLGEDVNEGI